MAIYSVPEQLTDGYFVSLEYWNSLYGENGSLVFLYDNYNLRTRSYHLKLSKSDVSTMNTSWAYIDSSWAVLNNNLVTWDTTLIDDYPTDSASLWNSDNIRPNSATIIESGYYLVRVLLNIYDYTNSNADVLFVHLVRESNEDGTLTTIATDQLYLAQTELVNPGYPTWANKKIIRSVNLQSVYWLEKNDTLYVVIQPYLSTGTGNTTFSLIPRNYTFTPTAYLSSFAKGSTSFVTTGIKTSFMNSGYIGTSPSFFEIQSIRLEQ